jgi:limonene-1,2-epoxide hydrolase
MMTMTSPSDVVRQFCAAVGAKDIGAIEGLLDEKVVYHNVGAEPSVGFDATLNELKSFFKMFDSMEFRIVSLSADGDNVLTERVDMITANGITAPIPVMGAFDVADGRIVAWRDYFDSGLVGKLLAGESVDPSVLP